MNLFDVYPLYNVVPKKAKDVYVYDEKNNKYLDLYGGHAVISIGHSHPHYIKLLKQQLGTKKNKTKHPKSSNIIETINKRSNTSTTSSNNIKHHESNIKQHQHTFQNTSEQ